MSNSRPEAVSSTSAIRLRKAHRFSNSPKEEHPHLRSRPFNFKLCLSLTAALLVLLLPAAAGAQITRGSIAGTVRDESGAVVPGVEVKVVATGTNTTRSATTDDEGFYRVGALDPGTYTVIVEKAGFSKVENTQVSVRTALETTFDTQLTVGNVTETVNVTATAEGITLNKTNPMLGIAASNRQVVEMPLSAGRDINQIALLAPLAVPAPGSTGISVNGQRARNNNFTIDGTDNNDISVTLATSTVIPEAVGSRPTSSVRARPSARASECRRRRASPRSSPSRSVPRRGRRPRSRPRAARPS